MKKETVLLTMLFLALPASATEPVACPFSAAELSKAFGSPVKEGTRGSEYSFGSGKFMSCRYEGSGFSLAVNQTVMKDADQVKGSRSMLAGKKEALPGDPDGAMRQTDQGDMTNPNLHYVRGRVIVELRVLGVGKSNPAFDAHNRRLEALRRIP